jgi:hypothetical protein
MYIKANELAYTLIFLGVIMLASIVIKELVR